MRKPIIAGNWKMNKTPEEAAQLVTELIPLVKDAKCDVVVCTPAVDFAAVKAVIEGTNIKLGNFVPVFFECVTSSVTSILDVIEVEHLQSSVK